MRGSMSENSDERIEADDDGDEIVPKISFEVTSFGSDPEVELLVKRLDRGDILIPPFQRDYVWRLPEASKFVESLLLGLPVPGLFFATDTPTNKQLVIDGQQRLKTLQFFYNGFFNPKPGDKTQRTFALTKVQEPFEGLTYATLQQHDRARLDTSIIHATTVKQTQPTGDDTSLYHIFERLNSGGRRLTDQEMRLAIYHGPLIDLIKALNDYPSWRKTFGAFHSRLKDQELILRFFALYYNHHGYQRPLSEFLNKYAGRNRNLLQAESKKMEKLFYSTIDAFSASLPGRPFRTTTSLNVAIFDSCMVGLAKRIGSSPSAPDPSAIQAAYLKLLQDPAYIESVSRSTADQAFVRRRIDRAIQAFSKC
jgi:Protein of unknown function DUF262